MEETHITTKMIKETQTNHKAENRAVFYSLMKM